MWRSWNQGGLRRIRGRVSMSHVMSQESRFQKRTRKSLWSIWIRYHLKTTKQVVIHQWQAITNQLWMENRWSNWSQVARNLVCHHHPKLWWNLKQLRCKITRLKLMMSVFSALKWPKYYQQNPKSTILSPNKQFKNPLLNQNANVNTANLPQPQQKQIHTTCTCCKK